ncbi:MAG: hypothetical protein AAGU19_14535 [Prolixibacteraceae bacterium]
MKVILISDIKGKSESIIPYGLRLARSLEAETDLIHILDRRVVQSFPTPYADSHTVAPGEKFSHDELVNKEKGEISEAIGNLLTREISKLNYPLKINVYVKDGSLINWLAGEDGSTGDTILLVNKNPDGQIFVSEGDLIDCCKIFNGVTLFIPPGLEFREYENMLLPADYTDKYTAAYKKMGRFTARFRSFINAVPVSDTEEIGTWQWRKEAEQYFLNSQINCNTMNGILINGDLLHYIGKIQPDLVLYPDQQKSLLKSLFKKDFLITLLGETNSPVLYCSP